MTTRAVWLWALVLCLTVEAAIVAAAVALWNTL